jgi:hypothetical protein
LAFLIQGYHVQFGLERGFNDWEKVRLGKQSFRANMREVGSCTYGLGLGIKILMGIVRALPQVETLSDHARIWLTNGLPRPQSNRQFKSKLGWLQQEGFSHLDKNVWERLVAGVNPI